MSDAERRLEDARRDLQVKHNQEKQILDSIRQIRTKLDEVNRDERDALQKIEPKHTNAEQQYHQAELRFEGEQAKYRKAQDDFDTAQKEFQKAKKERDKTQSDFIKETERIQNTATQKRQAVQKEIDRNEAELRSARVKMETAENLLRNAERDYEHWQQQEQRIANDNQNKNNKLPPLAA